jgi:hypothetical protein
MILLEEEQACQIFEDRRCEACLEVAGQHFEPVLGNKVS